MSANNLTNPPSAPNETTVAAMQEARQMAAKTPKEKKESTHAKLKKGQLAEQKLCDLRLAFDEVFAIIREAAVIPSSLLTELASVFHSNSIGPKFINRELVKKDIKLHKAEKEINTINAKRLKEALSENADLKSQLERMKQMTGTTGCPTPFGGINTPGFQNMYAPPNSFPGQNPVPPFPGSQSIHLGELLQRIMNLEAEVTKLQQRHISAQFQPQQQQFQSQVQVDIDGKPIYSEDEIAAIGKNKDLEPEKTTAAFYVLKEALLGANYESLEECVAFFEHKYADMFTLFMHSPSKYIDIINEHGVSMCLDVLEHNMINNTRNQVKEECVKEINATAQAVEG